MVDSTKSNSGTNALNTLTIPENTIIGSTSEVNNMDIITNITSIDNISTDTLINGGILWFNDLTQTDPLYIFPLAIGLTNLLNIEVILNYNLHNFNPFKKLKHTFILDTFMVY